MDVFNTFVWSFYLMGIIFLFWLCANKKRITQGIKIIYYYCVACLPFEGLLLSTTMIPINYNEIIVIALVILLFIKLLLTALAWKKVNKNSLYFFLIVYLCIVYIFCSATIFGAYYEHKFLSYWMENKSEFNFVENIFQDISQLPKYLDKENGRHPFLFKIRLSCIHVKIGLRYFYELPPYRMLNIITIFQYFLGKIVDLTILGSIASYIINILKGNKCQKKSSSKVCVVSIKSIQE